VFAFGLSVCLALAMLLIKPGQDSRKEKKMEKEGTAIVSAQ